VTGLRRALGAAVAAVLASPLATGTAAANGRYPAGNTILFAPNDPNLVVVQTTFGVLFSHDGGTTWDWLCEDAFGIPSTQTADPSLGITANGTLVAGAIDRLARSTDTGCDWSFAACPFEGQRIEDIVVRPDAPQVVLAITSTPAQSLAEAGASCTSAPLDAGADGGAAYFDQVFESLDDGATWSRLGVPIDPTVVVTTLDVAASDPHRIYVAGYRAGTGASTPAFFVSIDDGATWSERALPPLNGQGETAPYIASVDPTDADRVYVRTGGTGSSRLLVTNDAGATFEEALTLAGQMLGFALSADGAKIYAGGVTDGLFVAARSTMAFEKKSTKSVWCLASRGADLWACSNEINGFFAGVSSDDGMTFTPKLHLRDLRGTLACAPDATAAQCSGEPFQMLCRTFECGAGTTGDAGAVDGGDAGAGPGGTRSKAACGCSAVGGRSAALLPLCSALGIGIARRRRKARSISRRGGNGHVVREAP
jgi:photosystem II stability/assembly factor-like uncharacterized protein